MRQHNENILENDGDWRTNVARRVIAEAIWHVVGDKFKIEQENGCFSFDDDEKKRRHNDNNDERW